MRPIHSIRMGSLRCGVWRFTKTKEDGREFVSHSIKIDKRYYDKAAQEWKETTFLNAQDIANLHIMLPRVHDWIREDIEKARSADIPTTTEQPEESVIPF